MKVLLIGVGGVGESIAVIAHKHAASAAWLTQMVLADYNLERAHNVQARLGDPARFPVAHVDATQPGSIVSLARAHGVDLILNACDPRFNIPIFDAALEAGAHYMDMAMSLSERHPTEPFARPGVMLGDYQFAREAAWKAAGRMALVGCGVEPGLADVFAKYAEKHLFDEIDEIGIRDGSNLQVHGYEFAPNFSIWTTIEECLNPPVVWECDRGWYTTQPFSDPEVFDFPEGIGPMECVNVEHEEVLLVPRWVKCRRVTFKYGLGRRFIEYLKMLCAMGLDRKEKIDVTGVQVAPRDVVAACLPNPAQLGDRMVGKTCAGTWVKGRKNGRPREVYLYQVADNEWTMRRYGVQAVVWQTAVNPMIMIELISRGLWLRAGVLGPEAFDPDPFMDLMPEYEFSYGIKEMAQDGEQ
jgi:saccharopine dehydrogenase-like NADP-dependent oxidoreductase